MGTNLISKLSMATTGAAFIALGTFGMAPAEAITLTKIDYSGDINVAAKLSLLGSINQTVKVNNSYTVDNLSGRLSDEEDSELTIDKPFSYLDGFTDLLKTYNGSISSLTGNGSISKEGNFVDIFKFFYNKTSDVLTVDGYNFDKIKVCLSGTCQLSGNGNFSGSVSSFIVLPVSGTLNFALSLTATPLSDTQPVPEGVPEPEEVGFSLMVIGSFGILMKRKLAAKTKRAA